MTRHHLKKSMFHIFLVLLLPHLLLLSACTPTTTGAIRIRVSDARSDQPVANAIVVIPELSLNLKTDENGLTGIITVPILKNDQLNRMLPLESGNITILASAPSYRPCALFYAKTTKDRLRDPLTVYLFPSLGDHKNAPTTIIEAPEEDWVAALMKKYGVE